MILNANGVLYMFDKSKFAKYEKITGVLNETESSPKDTNLLPESCNPRLFVKVLQFIENGCCDKSNNFDISLEQSINLYKLVKKYEVNEMFTPLRNYIICKLSEGNILCSEECGFIISENTYSKLMNLYCDLQSCEIYVMFVISYLDKNLTVVVCDKIPNVNFRVIPNSLENKKILSSDEFKFVQLNFKNQCQCPSCGKRYQTYANPVTEHVSACSHIYYAQQCEQCITKYSEKCKFCQMKKGNICYLSNKIVCKPHTLQCSHIFEKEHILRWLEKNDGCPICK
jgi:hypothetical protein